MVIPNVGEETGSKWWCDFPPVHKARKQQAWLSVSLYVAFCHHPLPDSLCFQAKYSYTSRLQARHRPCILCHYVFVKNNRTTPFPCLSQKHKSPLQILGTDSVFFREGWKSDSFVKYKVLHPQYFIFNKVSHLENYHMSGSPEGSSAKALNELLDLILPGTATGLWQGIVCSLPESWDGTSAGWLAGDGVQWWIGFFPHQKSF